MGAWARGTARGRPASRPGRGREALQLRVDAVARPDLDLSCLDACDEAIERAHRRPTGDQALEVVDTAVTGADEALGRDDPPDRTAEVRAPCRDRDVLAAALTLEDRVALSHVGGGLAGLAHARGNRDRAGDVVVVDEVARRTDVLEVLLVLLEQRADGEADRGQSDRSRHDAAQRQRSAGEHHAASHRLALVVTGRLQLRSVIGTIGL